jgi:hypothetical protein
MARPLVISDCDEVLLHMIAPFRDWLAQTQDVTFTMNGNDFSRSMHYADGSAVPGPRCGVCWAPSSTPKCIANRPLPARSRA